MRKIGLLVLGLLVNSSMAFGEGSSFSAQQIELPTHEVSAQEFNRLVHFYKVESKEFLDLRESIDEGSLPECEKVYTSDGSSNSANSYISFVNTPSCPIFLMEKGKDETIGNRLFAKSSVSYHVINPEKLGVEKYVLTNLIEQDYEMDLVTGVSVSDLRSDIVFSDGRVFSLVVKQEESFESEQNYSLKTNFVILGSDFKVHIELDTRMLDGALQIDLAKINGRLASSEQIESLKTMFLK